MWRSQLVLAAGGKGAHHHGLRTGSESGAAGFSRTSGPPTGGLHIDSETEEDLMKLRLTGVIVLGLGLAVSAQSPAPRTGSAAVTFTKDVAPILQRSCQNCHRPGQMAPMSLMTYQ